MKESFFKGDFICYRTNDFQVKRQTLIFIHGLSGSSSAWLEYENKFGSTYNILTFDLRGHGKSAKPKKYKDYEIANIVKDIGDLIEYLGIKNYILISHSFGTAIAVELLKNHKEKFLSAVFISPIFDATQRMRTHITKPVVRILTSIIRIFPFSAKAGIHIDYSKQKYTADFDFKRIYSDISNTSLRVFLYCLDHLYVFNDDNYLLKIEMPVLMIHGKNDKIMPVKDSIEASKSIKNVRLVIFEKGNHILVLNNFAEVSKTIESFLSNL